MFNQSYQPLLQESPTGQLAGPTGGHFYQGDCIFGQTNRPGYGHQLMVTDRLPGIGLAPDGFGAGEDHPATAQIGCWGVELLDPFLHILSQQLQDAVAAKQRIGEATIPTRIFVCEAGGMVVICAGTTGYSAGVDLRCHWVRQKRLQGSPGTNDVQARAYNGLVHEGKINPCLGKVYAFEGIGRAHYDMAEGEMVFGNRVALVGAAEAGGGRWS